MKRFLTMCAGILLICQFTPPLTLAQNAGYEVKGVVVDKSGMPILGATVVEKGTTNGVSTGIDGDYAIRAAGPESVIEVSYVGYKTVSLVASSSLLAHLTLEEDAMGIDDVVVIGYGSVKKNDMTGSVVAIKAEEFNRGAVVSTQDMLKGKVPGVHIIPGDGGPGSSATIRVRGAASLNASNDPLIVIDGVPIAVDGGKGMANPLETINPNDIESFTVLKDASAAAIYGARAAFGVVLVTTKSGDSSGKTRISYSGRWGWNEPTTSTDYETRGYYSVYVNDLFWHADAGTNYTNYTEQDMMELWARRNDKVENPERPWVKIDQRDGRDTYVYYGNTDWYHYLFKDEHPNTSHSISLSGGNSKVKYMLSGNYYSEEGLFRQDPDRLQRINFRSKISFEILSLIHI